MSQVVVYKGVMVQPVDRSGDRILVQTSNAGDAGRVGLCFKEMKGHLAIFEGWVPESELVPING